MAERVSIEPAPPGFDPSALVPRPLPEGTWHIASVALDVSGSCNLACRYCAEAATQPRRTPMSHDTLQAAWHLLFPDGQPRRGASIRLGSGEPLLAYPLLRRLQQLVADGNGSAAEERPAIFLTTNGTLIDESLEDWLVDSGWHVKVSLDGSQPVHDRWRMRRDGGGTYAQVAPVAARLARRMGQRFSVTAVLCRGTDPQQVFDALEDLGVQRIELVPVAHQDSAVLPDTGDVVRYEQFAMHYAQRFLELPPDHSIPTLVRFQTRIIRAMGYRVEPIPCGAGRSFVGVGPDGVLYPCFRFVGLTSYRIGQVSSGIDQGAASAFQQGPGQSYDQRPACRVCWAAPLCGGPCFACAELFGPGDGQPLPLHCAYVLADARAAVWLVQQLRRSAPERLLAFLPHSARILDLL